MTQIPAANNLIIEMDSTRWRLLLNGHDDFSTEAHVLLEATTGDAMRYQALFAEKHQLPDSGVITSEQIQRVVLGWSSSDNAWHLGMMLTQDIASTRGSRWCELARWSEVDAGQPGGKATQAGTMLAYTMQRPFNLVPPKTAINGTTPPPMPVAPAPAPQPTTQIAFGSGATSPSIGVTSAETQRAPVIVERTRPATPYVETATATEDDPDTITEIRQPQPEVYAPPKPKRTLPLPQAPFKTGLWTLERDPNGVLQYRRSSSWVWSRLGRAAWYTFWALVYIFLSYATLNSTLALPNAGTMLPNPEVLPYLGLGSAVLLFILVLYILIDTILSPNLIVIDPYTRTIRMQRRDQTVWSKNANDLQSVYVSHIVELKHKKRKGQKESQWNVQHGEMNLYLGDKKFKCFLRVEDAEELPVDEFIADVFAEEGVRPLTTEGVVTAMQGAAMTISQALLVPCFYDHRTK